MGCESLASQPNQWLPEETIPGFRDTMNNMHRELGQIAQEVLRAIAVGLGQEDEHYLAKKHASSNHHLRLLHYLPIPAEDLEKERASRCMAHTDWSSITLLFQDDCGGLEVEDISKPGTFVPAEPIKNAVVVNAGDVLQMWSNGTPINSSKNKDRNKDRENHLTTELPNRRAQIHKPPSHAAASP